MSSVAQIDQEIVVCHLYVSQTSAPCISWINPTRLAHIILSKSKKWRKQKGSQTLLITLSQKIKDISICPNNLPWSQSTWLRKFMLHPIKALQSIKPSQSHFLNNFSVKTFQFKCQFVSNFFLSNKHIRRSWLFMFCYKNDGNENTISTFLLKQQ